MHCLVSIHQTTQESSSPGFTFLRLSALAQSPQFWILPQPKYSNLRRNLVWFNLQLAAHYPFCQISSPSTNCSPKTHQQRLFSPPRLHIIPPRQLLFIKTCCASSPGSSPTCITCQINLLNFSPAS
ncbi:hypothetical protein ATANTOWER_019587 [Ataeniobius toweri]|uniref:Uncharacterized protein n=1 Tax=Ataeniobius toweri TaxID=208326 RepID=A0ABU7B184_9TELE|nr:hypothetical protein [Ataeniobius toweri]